MTERRQFLLTSLKLFDLAVMVGSFALATWLLVYPQLNFLTVRVKLVNVILFLGFLVAWHGLFTWRGLYRSRHLSSGSTPAVDLVWATSIGSVVIWTTGILFAMQIVTLAFVAVFWVSTTLASIASRLVLRLVLVRAAQRPVLP